MLKRDATIDSIRGVAILLVILHHVNVQVIQGSTDPFLNIANHIFKPLITGGWVAVDLFFVLSGFLISGLLFKEYKSKGNIDFSRFFIRRSFKIYPGFFVFLVISLITSVVIYHFFGGERPYFKGYMYDALFLHNYLGGVYITTWSLDVEEAFYILLPIFFIAAISLKKLQRSTLVTTYLLLVLIGIIGRITANINIPKYNFLSHYAQTHFRLDALFFGVILSYFYHYDKSLLMNTLIRYSHFIMALCILILLPNFIFIRDNNWVSVVMLAINPLALGLLLILAIEYKPLFLEKCSWLNFLGVNSYAIYLWHPFINDLLIRNLIPGRSPQRFIIYLLTYLLISVIAGATATKYIEKPILYFRDKHFRRKTNPTINL
ncbi:MAG: acyltransferase [Bacteroidota bacterium]